MPPRPEAPFDPTNRRSAIRSQDMAKTSRSRSRRDETLAARQAAAAAAEAAEERRARRRAARAALWARVGEFFISIGRFLWERSWIFSVPLAAILALSLGSYSQSDRSFTVSTADDPRNYCGTLGACVADLMLGAFGLSAWWFVLGFFMIAFFAVRSLVRRGRGETDPDRINPPKFSAMVGFWALLLGSTSLEALRLRRFHSELPGEPGGVIGNGLAYALQHYVGIGVATVVFFALMVIGIALLLDFSWTDVAERIGAVIDDKLLSRFSKKPQPAARTLAESEEDETGEVVETVIDLNAGSGEPAAPLKIIKPRVEEVEKDNTLFSDQILPAAPASVTAETPQAPHPSLSLLDDPEPGVGVDEQTISMTSRLIVSKLKSYSIEGAVMSARPGPVITQYMLEPGPGVKGSQIENVREDLRRALGVQAVRVVLNVPGSSCIALEVPNPVRQMVRLKEILKSELFEKSKSPLTLAIGKEISGKPFVMDLAKTPHLLVAGTTGSGKSVGVNAMILSMLYRNDPSQLRLVLIDPKMLEFSLYNGIPHLLCPVVTDMNKAASAFKWLTREMDNRYAVMSKIGVRQFTGYNEKVAAAEERGEPIRDPFAAPDDPNPAYLKRWPYIVCVVDELADLMFTNRKEVEGEITRLTQKARAAGIHLILATQRPSVDVVTSLIKANVPTRISFQVASATDSRVILGESGAEQLLGYGDMLLHRPGESAPTRIQGCFVADGEVQRVTDELRKYGSPSYVTGVTESADEDAAGAAGETSAHRSGESDPLYDKAVQIVLTERRASISYVQRVLGIGYNRSANLLEAMEEAGLLSKPNASGKRQILVPERG